MDERHDIPEVRPTVSANDFIRSVGLTLITPINTLALSDEETELWWQFAKTQEYMFTDWERGNREGWIMRFRDMRHMHLDIGGDGYALLVNAFVCDTPELHFCIWNPRRPFQKTVEAGTQLFDFVFEQMKPVRIGAYIPENNRLALKFATLMGFRFEGCIRQAFRFFDKSYDVHAYGLLKAEWSARQRRLNGRH